jgi:hypothetical protein
MRGCARSCLTGIVGYAVTVAAFLLLFRRFGPDREATVPASFVAGFLLTLALSLLWSARGLLRDRGLIRDALAGQPPVDGKWAGFSGIIRSSSPLTAPISGKSTVAFKYTISQSVGSGKSAHRISHYEGTALAAPKISTSAGTYRLLAVPTFDMETSDVEKTDALRHAAAYLAATTFETDATPKQERQTVEKEWTDDDGVFRRDRKGPDEADLTLCRFEEQMIAQGEQVCILGLYSAARGGIIPDPNWANQTRIIKGDGESGVEQLGARARRYVIGALVCGAISAGIVWANISGTVAP